MKKLILIALAVLLGLLLVLGGICLIRKVKGPGQGSLSTPSAAPEESVTEISLEERPFVSLTPRADGKEFTLDISKIIGVDTVEYELVYLSNGLSRGVVGSVTLNGEDSLTRKLLLGTCSKNVCKYDEGVSEGTLTIRFRGSGSTKKFTSDFHLQSGEKILTSVDQKFRLEGGVLLRGYYIVMSTIGLPPKDLPEKGEIVSEPYGVFGSGTTILKGSKLTLVLAKSTAAPSLYFWQGSAWELKSDGFTVEGNTLTAPVDSVGTFIVIAGLN